MSIALRLWLNKYLHLALLLLVGVFLVLIYAAAHGWLRSTYQESIKALSDAAFKSYDYRRSADGTKVEISLSGQSIEGKLDKLDKAPFGLERLDSYRGILNDHIGKAAVITAFYQQRKARFLALLRKVGPSGEYRLPVTALGCTNSTLSAVLTGEEVKILESLGLEAFPDQAAALLTKAPLFDSAALGAAIIPPTSSDAANRALEQGARAANSLPGGRVDGALPAECRALVIGYFSAWSSQAAVLHCLLTNVTAGASSGWTLEQLLCELSRKLQSDLHAIAMGETGSFWLMGRYRWWELIFWVWFGVLTMGLFKFTPAFLGSSRSAKWEPRETLMVFPKFFYAPILALALFFLAGFLGVGGLEASELGRSSPAIIGVAFILGLFPNTSFRIIQDLCTKLFREDLTKTPPPAATSETKTVQSKLTAAGGTAVYTVADLKRNVSAHVTAVLE